MRIAFLDIEATNLTGSFGMLLSCCIKPLGGRTIVFSLHDRQCETDRRMVRQIINELNKYDILIGWYSKRYDIPFLRTRALKHGVQFIDPLIRHIDLYDTAKHRLRMHSNRLEAVTEFLGIHGKTKISSDAWNKAVRGDKKAMKEVIAHNKADVRILERCYNMLKRQVNTISRVQ